MTRRVGSFVNVEGRRLENESVLKIASHRNSNTKKKEHGSKRQTQKTIFGLNEPYRLPVPSLVHSYGMKKLRNVNNLKAKEKNASRVKKKDAGKMYVML